MEMERVKGKGGEDGAGHLPDHPSGGSHIQLRIPLKKRP